MFTSLRSRLWLSYAFVITLALAIVLAVLFAFLIRNPLSSRETQQQLRTVRDLILANPQQFIDHPEALSGIGEARDVRILVFDSSRQLLFDSDPAKPELPFPRRNILARNVQNSRDAGGGIWLYTSQRLSPDRILVVAAPRPRVPVLNVFTDAFLKPILQGGVVALLLSLVLAYVLSRWVADPLQQLVLAARDYPAAELEPIAPRGPHEVQDLTRAFNSMVERVENSQRSQRDFVANVSHELKTPLTSIQGFAQALLDDTADTPESRRQAAQIIYSEAGRLHRMALDLLDLARLEAGTADLEMSDVDLGALLQNVIDKFTHQAQKAGLRLRLELPEKVPPLRGDGDRLAQVFSNLVDNALKFSSAGGAVTLSATQAGSELKIEVSDTGSGIPKDALPRLFDRFYQVDPARPGGEKHGAGLGLAIAQEIVQAHSGRMDVRSEVGSGTTVAVYLPLAA
jgi:signal transduction histidine kinase